MNQKSKPFHGGNVWAAARKWGTPLEEIIDFSANINPLGPSVQSIDAINQSIKAIHNYPEPDAMSCRTILAKHLSIPIENLSLGNGGAELIYLLGRLFYKKRVIVLAPTFAEYGQGILDANIKAIPLDIANHFSLPIEEILQELQFEDLLFLGNPNNPTGKVFERDELLEIINVAKEKNVTVIVDEAFIDFIADDKHVSLRSYVDEYHNLIVLGSLTKFFAIPALRIGYAVSSKQTIKKIQALLPPWNTNLFALVAAEAALLDLDYIQQTKVTVAEEREFLYNELSSIGLLDVLPSDVNFLLLSIKSRKITAKNLYEQLEKQGILIRTCDSFTNLTPYHFRIAVRTRAENERLLQAIKEVLMACN
ncbi:threonine-phosphate decarboxylase [Desulfuribacillus alkaliarsenatis]|uniref:threonine-phosphate decarboxylase n=1 Tax=Desulfuribacillus alkaliarsenatis TaxID=766136 RepID=A0A1E5G4K3_9FIRM|nr:threonine-phosphate decarboxylase [Desulfuribacillus alkaliarsenatis]